MANFALQYAKAFQQVAIAQRLDRAAVSAQLNDFAATLASSRELYEVFDNPALPHSDKVKLVNAIAEKVGFDPAVRNFVLVLIDHQRLGSLAEIAAQYLKISDEASGIHEAEIVSARELSDADKQVLAAQAAKLAGGEVRVIWKQDAALLGGAVVKIGATVYDGSVRAQLGQMERHLAGVQ